MNQQHPFFFCGFFEVTFVPPTFDWLVDLPLRTIYQTVLNKSSIFLPSLALTNLSTAPRLEAYSFTTA